jgi:DNA-binding transcriptional LysR family regulator
MAAEYAKGRYTLYSGLEFRHLRYFVAVAEECNFGRAALRLHLTQPSLSTQIKKLEDCIHATLFRRGRAGAELTPAGRHFLEAAKRLLHMSTLAFQSTSSVHSGINLPLRFGYSPFINHQLVEATVSGYRDLVPDGQIEPSSAGSAALIAMVAEGHLDAALVIMPIGDHKLFVHRIRTQRVLVCLRQDDPLARLESLSKNHIEDRLRITFSRDHHPLCYDEIMRKFAKAKIRLTPTDFVSSPTDMQFLVKIGAGFGMMLETVPLDPELTLRSIAGLSIHVKTAFICPHDTQRHVLPLLASRMAKMCADVDEMSGKKRPVGSVGGELPLQLPMFG